MSTAPFLKKGKLFLLMRFFVEVKEKPYKRFCIFEKTNSGG